MGRVALGATTGTDGQPLSLHERFSRLAAARPPQVKSPRRVVTDTSRQNGVPSVAQNAVVRVPSAPRPSMDDGTAPGVAKRGRVLLNNGRGMSRGGMLSRGRSGRGRPMYYNGGNYSSVSPVVNGLHNIHLSFSPPAAPFPSRRAQGFRLPKNPALSASSPGLPALLSSSNPAIPSSPFGSPFGSPPSGSSGGAPWSPPSGEWSPVGSPLLYRLPRTARGRGRGRGRGATMRAVYVPQVTKEELDAEMDEYNSMQRELLRSSVEPGRVLSVAANSATKSGQPEFRLFHRPKSQL